MLIESSSHFITFAIDISPAFATEEANTKFFVVGLIQLVILSIKIGIQCFYLGKFLFQHHLPLFWVRDLIMSCFDSIKLISKIVKGMNLTMKIHQLTQVDLGEDSSEVCAICLCKLEQGKKLYCGHAFHELCLLRLAQQFGSEKKCPQCRETILFTPAKDQKDLKQIRSIDCMISKAQSIKNSINTFRYDLNNLHENTEPNYFNQKITNENKFDKFVMNKLATIFPRDFLPITLKSEKIERILAYDNFNLKKEEFQKISKEIIESRNEERNKCFENMVRQVTRIHNSKKVEKIQLNIIIMNQINSLPNQEDKNKLNELRHSTIIDEKQFLKEKMVMLKNITQYSKTLNKDNQNRNFIIDRFKKLENVIKNIDQKSSNPNSISNSEHVKPCYKD